MEIRHHWTRAEIRSIYSLPLPELIFQAQSVHRKFHKPEEVQFCRLLSIKTGACPEDCAYCSQSAHYKTELVKQKLMRPAEVLEAARRAKADGATRFCMGAAWRQAPEGKEFEDVLAMVRGVAEMGLEACCTLGMLTSEQAVQLKEAGLTAYNHNLDTSPEFYGNIITTRVYADRIRTIENVRRAGITVCCGGILGLGESEEDRIGLLEQLANFDPHPESVPINVLARIPGTPLADVSPLDPMIFVRMIAATRILMPAARVRLSGGRHTLSREAIALCFLAGANSIFTGEKLLTTPNPPVDQDKALLDVLGMRPMQNA